MRTPIRWVGVAVVTSATLGGAAAMIYVPGSSSAATKPLAAASLSRDYVTPAITTIANQAQQLNSEIVAAQTELANLKNQVSAEANVHYYAPSPAPVVRVQTSSSRPEAPVVRRVAPTTVMTIAAKRPVTHTTTGASGKGSERGDGSSSESSSSSGQGDN